MAEETTSRGYPLPNPDNIAREDATRIRQAIEAISADMTALEGDSAVASETVVGSVRLATAAEATEGTATNAVPVVKRVKDMITAGINATVPSAIATAIANLVGSAPTTLDTLSEIAAAIENDRDALDVLDAAIGAKLSKASNLSDLGNVATARTNLGLGALAMKGVVDATALIADGIVTYAKLAAGAVATAAELCANTASKLLSVSSLWSAASVVDLGNVSGTVTIDFATGLNFKMTTTGNITLANPTNLKSGQAFGLKIAMGGAHTIAVGSEWQVIGGTAPTYNNTNGTNNYISGQRCDAGIIAYAGGKL